MSHMVTRLACHTAHGMRRVRALPASVDRRAVLLTSRCPVRGGVGGGESSLQRVAATPDSNHFLLPRRRFGSGDGGHASTASFRRTAVNVALEGVVSLSISTGVPSAADCAMWRIRAGRAPVLHQGAWMAGRFSVSETGFVRGRGDRQTTRSRCRACDAGSRLREWGRSVARAVLTTRFGAWTAAGRHVRCEADFDAA